MRNNNINSIQDKLQLQAKDSYSFASSDENCRIIYTSQCTCSKDSNCKRNTLKLLEESMNQWSMFNETFAFLTN